MSIKIKHPEHGQANAGEWQLAEFLRLGWRVAEPGIEPEEVGDHSEDHGDFVDALESLDGIGPALARKIADLIPDGETLEDLADFMDTEQGAQLIIDLPHINERVFDKIRGQV